MANTQKYLNHLLQNTGITPACSEEERAAADIIAKTFSDHGFEPEVQEFSASGSAKVVRAVLGIAVFIGAVLMGIGGVVGIIGLLLTVAAAVLFTMERTGRPILSRLGAGGLSQNVIAYHKASGPLASPRNRPVVVVAHYDSPRADFLCQEPYVSYRPLLVKLLPYAMLAPAVIAVARLLPIPDAAKVVLWLLAIVAALVPLANAVAIIANRFVLPYTTGAVCNKASVAAMLGVMDAVSPYQGAGEEFSEDVPFDEYFAEQKKIAEEAIAAAEAAAAAETAYPHELEVEDTAEGADEDEAVEEETDSVSESDAEETEPADAGATATFEAVEPSSTVSMDSTDVMSAAEQDAEEAAMASEEAEGDEEAPETGDADEEPVAEDEEPEEPSVLNASGNYRYGADAIRGLGMVASSCALVYEAEKEPEDSELTAFDVPAEEDEIPADDDTDTAVDDEVDEKFDSPEPDTEVNEPSETDDAAADDDMVDEVDTEDEPIEVPPEDIEVLDEEPESDEVEPEADDNSEPIADEPGDEPEPEQQDELPLETETDQAPAETVEPGSTQVFQAPAEGTDDPSRTISMPARPVETVDSIMAEISSSVSSSARPRAISVPSTADAPSPRVPESANRSSLFDLPDPSATPVDPFASPVDRSADDAAAAARSAFTVIDSNTSTAPAHNSSNPADRVETISAPAPAREEKHGVFSRLFGRKKKRDDSMSEWLGVEDDFDAKRDGADIGSWDNFDDDSGWKGGATGADGVTEDELRDAVTSMGDDELLGHDIWFVATGASENGNAGIQAFLNEHRDKLRGVFLINLECIGAGEVSMLATEGEQRTLKGDKRIMKLVSRVSSDFHHEYGAVDMPYVTTDAYPAMSMSLRSLTLGGIEGSGFALGHTEDDQPFNVDPDNVTMVSDVVTEVIRRS